MSPKATNYGHSSVNVRVLEAAAVDPKRTAQKIDHFDSRACRRE